LGASSFILQNCFKKEWAENCMMQLMVVLTPRRYFAFGASSLSRVAVWRLSIDVHDPAVQNQAELPAQVPTNLRWP
jgi:hypothetical protein